MAQVNIGGKVWGYWVHGDFWNVGLGVSQLWAVKLYLDDVLKF